MSTCLIKKITITTIIAFAVISTIILFISYEGKENENVYETEATTEQQEQKKILKY